MPENNMKETKKKRRPAKDDAIDLQELILVPENFQEKRANHPNPRQEGKNSQTKRKEKEPKVPQASTPKVSHRPTKSRTASNPKLSPR